jgi:hypothetical protein
MMESTGKQRRSDATPIPKGNQTDFCELHEAIGGAMSSVKMKHP